ncbi:MAG: WG repeat-containing protein [Oscillospiraceae bacterium]|nr:WG repeat-containing protein [Oscillospiraceae bacterium]
MKKKTRILIGIGLCALLGMAWMIAVNSKSTAEKQLILINEARVLMADDIYSPAVPLLEEAAGYDAAHTPTAESELKRAYLALMHNKGFSRRYTNLLEKQMNRRDPSPDTFVELANHYLSVSKTPEALEVMRAGIEKTGSSDILTLYENSRYAFEISRVSYDNVTIIYDKKIQVQNDGKWGIANADGTVVIPCKYDKISTFSNDRAIVMNGAAAFAVDRYDDKIAITHENVLDISNFSDNRLALRFSDGWRRASGDFELGINVFEDIGMYSERHLAAKVGGKWGVIDFRNGWLIEPEFDEIIQDELGRCYAQGAVFVRDGNNVYLLVNGDFIGDIYEDACPFGTEGYAAVKMNGKWGFIDTSGVEVIPFVYDDALSFGQHLAAVKVDGFWGYISLYGHLVINAEFLEAKGFSGGNAPVRTDRGWQFITLIEYKKGLSL